MSTVESIARPRRNGERRRAPTASISKESPAITGVDRKSGSAGMPRPTSYAVFCLKKKKVVLPDGLDLRVEDQAHEAIGGALECSHGPRAGPPHRHGTVARPL